MHLGIPHDVFGYHQKSQGSIKLKATQVTSYSLLESTTLTTHAGAMATYMKYPKGSLVHKVNSTVGINK